MTQTQYVVAPEGTSVPCLELVEWVNSFLPDLFAADAKRGKERVTAFVDLANKWEAFTTEDAISFAMADVDQPTA